MTYDHQSNIPLHRAYTFTSLLHAHSISVPFSMPIKIPLYHYLLSFTRAPPGANTRVLNG
jgi:hypothetical protein